MPNQDKTATSPVDVCPACRDRAGDGLSLYAPNGAVIKPNNGRSEPTAAPLPDPFPPETPTPEPRPLDAATQSVHFWQGLAVGLGAAIVILFLLAAVLAG